MLTVNWHQKCRVGSSNGLVARMVHVLQGSWPTSFLPDEFKSFRIADFNVNFYTNPMCRELPKDREQVENHFCFDRCIETWLSLEELILYVQ